MTRSFIRLFQKIVLAFLNVRWQSLGRTVPALRSNLCSHKGFPLQSGARFHTNPLNFRCKHKSKHCTFETMPSQVNPANVIIRKAMPEDSNDIVPLIHSSGPIAWNFVFQEGNRTAFDFLQSAYRKRGNTISYTNHFVAEKEGNVVGSILQYTQPSFLALTVGTAFQILLLYKWNAAKVMARGLKTETIIQPPKPNCLYLGHIAVLETHRNQGIAKQLIEFMIQRNPGYKTIALDVSIENPSAIALYQKLGFVIKETRDPIGWEGKIPSHHYMEREM